MALMYVLLKCKNHLWVYYIPVHDCRITLCVCICHFI